MMPGATDDIVNGIIEKWSAAFGKLDAGLPVRSLARLGVAIQYDVPFP